MQGLHNRTGFLYFVVAYFAMVSLSAVAVLFEDKLTFLRERSAGVSIMTAACPDYNGCRFM